MTGGPVTLSPGGDADLRDVLTVMEDSFDPRFGEAWTLSQCAGLLPLPGVWLTLARKDDEVLGFALARLVADEAELLLLAVKAAGQRQGVGRILLDIHSDESKAQRAVTLVHLIEQRHFLTAGTAPARPEVQHHDLTLQLVQRYDLQHLDGQREPERR